MNLERWKLCFIKKRVRGSVCTGRRSCLVYLKSAAHTGFDGRVGGGGWDGSLAGQGLMGGGVVQILIFRGKIQFSQNFYHLRPKTSRCSI